LTAAGTSFDNVLKTTVYLADMADFAKMNSVYAKYFDGNNKPSRSCVAARELPKGVKVEIDVVALEGTC
jgi:2-iminobutanoate/2-iminopropanoate deaminase